ncbi:MAG: hypothetical protein ACWIPJ_09315 [Polaribacter sp.]
MLKEIAMQKETSIICTSCDVRQETIKVLKEQLASNKEELQQKNKEINCLFSLVDQKEAEDNVAIKKTKTA